jgi:hypothetical protein
MHLFRYPDERPQPPVVTLIEEWLRIVWPWPAKDTLYGSLDVARISDTIQPVPTVRPGRIRAVPIPNADTHLLRGTCDAVNKVTFHIDRDNTGALPQQAQNPRDDDTLGFPGAGRPNDCAVSVKKLAG